MALLALAGVSLACGPDAAREADRRDSAEPVTTSMAGATTASRPACPPTGQWTQCAILQRLDRAGLAPRLDSAATPTEPPLTATGFLVHLSRAAAEVYLYADDRARKRDEGKLERARYLEYAEPVSMQTLSTLISSSNAIVILNSRNDHQRERVGDAITAGPPSKEP